VSRPPALASRCLGRVHSVRRENGNDDSSSKLGRERKEIPSGRPTYLATKVKGDNSMSVKRAKSEGVHG
jgi:hypothetical protein